MLASRANPFCPDHIFVTEPLEGLAKVCEQTGRAAEAQQLSARAARIRDGLPPRSQPAVSSSR